MAQLHEDLVTIRNHQQLSVQDVHERTRITIYNIEQLENGVMFDSDRNPTYIRNFARTYGKSLGIALDDMSHALDLMQEGNYDGFLARKYAPGQASPSSDASETELPPPAKEAQAPETPPAQKHEEHSETPASDETEARPAPKKPKQDEGGAPPGKASEPEKKPAASKLKQTSSGTAQMKPSGAANAKPDKAKEKKPARRVLDGSSIQPGYAVVDKKKPGARDVNWSKLRQDAEKPKSGLSLQLIAGIVAIVLMLAGLTYWLTLPEDDFAPDGANPELETPSETVPLPDTTDTLSADQQTDPLLSDTLDAPVPPDPQTTTIALADTMEVVVYAAYGTLAPFRVQSDTFEQRRPYWVGQGEGMRIRFINEMRLSANLENMLVLYDGRVLTTFDEASTDTELVITRSLFEEAESLEAITDEEFPEGLEPPRNVQDRPVME